MLAFVRRGGSTNKCSSIPENQRIYVCGDIHGHLDALDDLLERIDSDDCDSRLERTIVFLGDYVDRGPRSAHVIERLLQSENEYRCIFLKGNHEAMLLASLEDARQLSAWASQGGHATLASYGLRTGSPQTLAEAERTRSEFRVRLPGAHLDFLLRLRSCFECGDYFFVHAGVNPRRRLHQQREPDLLWIRNEFLRFQAPFEKIIVHGHTPVASPDVRANRINIDTGAYVTGKLCCLVLERSERRFV